MQLLTCYLFISAHWPTANGPGDRGGAYALHGLDEDVLVDGNMLEP